MSKRFSTLDTTRLLFEHPKILFRMIEWMDRNEARYIRESDLVAEVMDYTRTLGKADRARVRLALNTDNLFAAACNQPDAGLQCVAVPGTDRCQAERPSGDLARCA